MSADYCSPWLEIDRQMSERKSCRFVIIGRSNHQHRPSPYRGDAVSYLPGQVNELFLINAFATPQY